MLWNGGAEVLEGRSRGEWGVRRAIEASRETSRIVSSDRVVGSSHRTCEVSASYSVAIGMGDCGLRPDKLGHTVATLDLAVDGLEDHHHVGKKEKREN